MAVIQLILALWKFGGVFSSNWHTQHPTNLPRKSSSCMRIEKLFNEYSYNKGKKRLAYLVSSYSTIWRSEI